MLVHNTGMRSEVSISLAALVLLSSCRACSKDPEIDDDNHVIEHVEPQFPTEGVDINPLAQRFCKAVHELPARRRAECCSAPPSVQFVAQCTAALSKTLEDKTIELAETEVVACEAVMKKVHEGCDWVGPFGLPVPPECSHLVKGKLEAGGACRSSLECKSGLRCAGSGINDRGQCAPPAADKNVCNLALDGLATYARQDAFEAEHPQCTGYCERNRCASPLAAGMECKHNAQCGREGRCGDGKCIAGARGALGEPCLGDDCSYGLRCFQHQCIEPKALGEACTNVFECKADCISGKCAQGCGQLPPILRRPPTLRRPGTGSQTATGTPAAPR